MDSKTGHYITTVAHRASLSRQHTAMEGSTNATSSCSTARPAEHTLPHIPEVYRMRIPPYSGHAVVVLSTVLANEKFLLQITKKCYYIVILVMMHILHFICK